MEQPADYLKVTLVQSELHWQNPGANMAMFEEKIWQMAGTSTDIIVLPEMFTTGFTMEAGPYAEPMNLTTFKWMKQQAAQTGAVVTGSYIVKEEGKFYNRMLWMQPDGQYLYYDKRHLFHLAGEDRHYQPGAHRLIVQWKGWRICPLICYDLRFPVWSRNTSFGYDCLIYVANWPVPRLNAWDILLKARAVENVAYCVGVNRIGKDENGMQYAGHSAVISPKGNELFFGKEDACLHTEALNYQELAEFRYKFPVQLDADIFQITGLGRPS